MTPSLISVVVTLCHLVTVDPDAAPITTCFELVPFRVEMNVNACWQTQTGIALWKERSKYAGEEYYIGGYRCEPGNYELKDAI